MRVRALVSLLASSLLIAGLVALPATPAQAGPSIGALAGAGERPGATRLSFTAGDRVGAQVDVGSGNLMVTVDAFSLPEVNRTADIVGYYNSAAVGLTPVSRVGKGWGLTYTPDVRLVANGDGSVTYHAAGGLTGVFDLVSGSSTNYVPASGFKMSMVKTSSGWTLTENESQDALRFDTAGALVSITDRNGNATSITASGSGTHKTISVATPAGASGWSNDASISTASGVTTIKHGDPASPLRTARFEPVGTTGLRFVDARSRNTTFDFTSTGLITKITAPGSVVTEFTYDANGRVTSIKQNESSAGGPGNSITRLAYPSATQTLLAAPDTNQTQAVSSVPHTTYTLDATQRVTTTVDAAGRTRSRTYTANFDTQTSTQGSGGTASTTTNTWGANNGTSLTKTESPAGSSQQLAYTGTGASQYNPTSSTADAGNTSTYTYNGAGNQLTSANAPGDTASVTYNSDGTVATATSPSNGSNVSTYGYTDKRLTSITPVTGSSLGSRAYTYDTLGRLKTATNGRGTTRTYTYNLNDQVTQVAFSGAGASAQSSSYGYDTAGRLASRTDSASGSTTATTTWSYDQLGRLTSRQTTLASGAVGGSGGVVSYTYDKASNLTSADSYINDTVTYSYDASGTPTSVTYPDDQQGSPGVMRFTYDNQGRRTGTYLNADAALSEWSARSRNDYDPNGRVTRVRADNGPGTDNIVDITYCYAAGTTPAGGCTNTAANNRDKLVWKRDNCRGKTTTYTYDTAGRLTGANVSSGPTFSYGFDARGNRTSSSNGSTSQTLTFNAANQITTTGYTYDGTGNLGNDPSTGTSSIAYTGADQLKTVTQGRNTYDYLHGGVDNVELLRQTSPTGTYVNTYGRNAATGVPVLESVSWDDGTDIVDTAVISDPITGTPLMLRTYFGYQGMYIYDGTPGAPIAMITSDYTPQFTYDYDPFGVPTLTQGANDSRHIPQNPYTFGGTGVKDRTTGWVHYANRYYNPKTGTWTQQDNLDAPLDPANANRYAYVGGDPINNTDPTGQFCLPGAVAVGAGAAAGVLGVVAAVGTGGVAAAAGTAAAAGGGIAALEGVVAYLTC